MGLQVLSKQLKTELLRYHDLLALKKAVALNKQETIDFILAQGIQIDLGGLGYQSGRGYTQQGTTGFTQADLELTVEDVLLLQSLTGIWHCYRGYSLFEFGSIKTDYQGEFIRQLVINTIQKTGECVESGQVKQHRTLFDIFYSIYWATKICHVKQEGYKRSPILLPESVKSLYIKELTELPGGQKRESYGDVGMRKTCEYGLKEVLNNNKHGLYLDLYDFIQQFETVRLAEIRKLEEQVAQKKKQYLQTRVFT